MASDVTYTCGAEPQAGKGSLCLSYAQSTFTGGGICEQGLIAEDATLNQEKTARHVGRGRAKLLESKLVGTLAIAKINGEL